VYATYPCRVWFWDRVSAINELICDTSIHKGQRGVTTATNFGTKFATNAFLWEITRMWLLITGGFHGRPIQRRYYWLQGSKRRCHGNQILAKIGKKSHKMAITSVVWEQHWADTRSTERTLLLVEKHCQEGSLNSENYAVILNDVEQVLQSSKRQHLHGFMRWRKVTQKRSKVKQVTK